MSHDAYRRRVKQLIKRLAAMQEDDCPVNAASLLSAKHMLRNSSHCTLISISDDPQLYPTICPPRDSVPEFIVSQLEAQRLTSRNSQGIVISPVVAFVLDSLTERQRVSDGYPTVVTWFSREYHRSRLVFAHLFFRMADRSYTIKELLELHPTATHIPKPLTERVESDPELSLAAIMGSHELQTTHNKRQERSTETSEDIVLKGNIRRRAARDGQRDSARGAGRFSQKQSSRESTQATTHTVVPESSNETSHELQHQLEISREMTSREPSMPESGSNIVIDRQPIPAPAGELAQRNEGFQRFWKAVVSPTHVRVTAGGKIVPNNRGPTSPSSKRPKETPAVEDHGAPDKPVPATSATDRVPMFLGQPHPAIMPQIIPGFPAGQQPMYPGMPLFPMAFGPPFHPGFAFPAQQTPAPAGTGLADGALKEMQNSSSSEGVDESSAVNTDKVKVSPPEQFDTTRPFWFNGQVMYPLRTGAIPGQQVGSFMPIPMLGFPPGVAGSLTAQMMSGSANGGLVPSLMHPVMQPMMPAMAPTNNPAPMPTTAPMTAPNVDAKFQPPMAPHVSSIRQSDITKKQIANFRTTLKFFEDQLQFNRHQIDEKEVESKIQQTKENIEKFTASLQVQLQYEKSYYPRGEGDNAGQQPEKETSSQVIGSRPGDNKTVGKVASMPARGEPMRSPGQEQGGNMTCIGESGKARYNFSPEHSPSPSFTESSKGLGFSSGAALAPVFEPRNVAAATWSASDRRPESREQKDQRLMVTGEKAMASFKGELPASRSLTASTHTTTSDGTSSQRDQKYSVPYLLGSLPPGVDPRTAKDTDYTYVRPLTDDEVRARFLYWGKAPPVVRQGLPKYDGRHFYPPSPVKKGMGSSSSDFTSPRALTGLAKTDPVGESHDDTDPFQMAASARGSAKKTHGVSETAIRQTYSFQSRDSDGLDTTGSLSSGGIVSEMSRALGLHASYVGVSPASPPDVRCDKSSAKLLKTMVKKCATSSAVSPATAHGYLPPYKGHAAASLSPSINKQKVSPIRDVSPSKVSVSDGNDLSDGGAMISPVRDKRGENRPLITGLPEDQFSSSKLDRAERHKRSMLAK